MKKLNILSLTQASKNLDSDSFQELLTYYGVELRGKEIEDLQSLTDSLYEHSGPKYIFDDFYLGYNIPQISKEFDLLRFSSNSVINIELKSESTHDKIKKQLSRNSYYLSGVREKTLNFTYISDTNELYWLNEGEVEKVEISFLLKALGRQNSSTHSNNPDEIFNPSDYLVSPFNSTDKFLKDQYFLTGQQEIIKKKIIDNIKKSHVAGYYSVTGSAGTGKTLLVYDIAKELKREKKIIIIHCGYLNKGQHLLNENGWKIIEIRNLNSYDLTEFEIVFIDEVQRIYPKQLDTIIKTVSASKLFCVFSYDKLQTLSRTELLNDIDSKINAIPAIIKNNLSEKIRTNKEIATFIKAIFNSRREVIISNAGNIDFVYFSNNDDAKDYITSTDQSCWETLRFTASQYKKEHHENYSNENCQNSHRVIGQEFDNVAVVIDSLFSYNEAGNLTYSGRVYYDAVKMLFQNMTRTRKKLRLIIINNPTLLKRCMSLLK